MFCVRAYVQSLSNCKVKCHKKFESALHLLPTGIPYFDLRRRIWRRQDRGRILCFIHSVWILHQYKMKSTYRFSLCISNLLYSYAKAPQKYTVQIPLVNHFVVHGLWPLLYVEAFLYTTALEKLHVSIELGVIAFGTMYRPRRNAFRHCPGAKSRCPRALRSREE